jgi:TFIIF-interacting CTD phosphatase-like protein
MSKKLHVILDLDETLISSKNLKSEQELAETNLEYFSIYENQTPIFTTFKRPNLELFLGWLKENANISIWSAGEKYYVLDVVKNIFPNFNPRIILWRDQCDLVEKQYGVLKKIDWLKNQVDISGLGFPILIDDVLETCNANIGNCIQIPPFNADSSEASKDEELLNIIYALENFKSEF